MQPGALQAVKILVRGLGLFRALGVIWRLTRRQGRGEPFHELPPPDSEEERLSREQIGPGLILYDELCKVVSEEEARAMTRDAVISGAIAFLRKSIGPLRARDLKAMDETQREAFVQERGKRFFNATMRWDKIEHDEVRFTVTSCRFPRLCREAGFPQLAPLFCEGDATFFGSVEPNVTLERPHTIAGGAKSCPFTLRWVGESLDDPKTPE